VTALRRGLDTERPGDIADLAEVLDVTFQKDSIILDGEDVSEEIRTESAGNMASKVAALPEVRAALLQRQRAFARAPGLVADGRDMGTVVFPSAEVKIFLTASAEERAKRRYKQLKDKGLDVSLPRLAAEIRERDQRDRNRSVAPLKAAAAALEVESTGLSVEEVFERVLERVLVTWPDLKA
jgi:cytidylate kinase